jgi:hypothetical protein
LETILKSSGRLVVGGFLSQRRVPGDNRKSGSRREIEGSTDGTNLFDEL